MAHSAMYQLQSMLIGQIYDAKNEAHALRYRADGLDFQRLQKEKQLEVLKDQIEKANAYEQQQRELAAEKEA